MSLYTSTALAGPDITSNAAGRNGDAASAVASALLSSKANPLSKEGTVGEHLCELVTCS